MSCFSRFFPVKLVKSRFGVILYKEQRRHNSKRKTGKNMPNWENIK